MKLKYMGASHVHTLGKGDDFGGRLGTPIPQDVVFSRENSWVVDTDEVGLSADAVAVLVEVKEDFKDVTGRERIPTNLHQQIFLGLPKSEASDDVSDDEPAVPNDGDVAASKVGPDDTPSTSAGGSTRRTRGT